MRRILRRMTAVFSPAITSIAALPQELCLWPKHPFYSMIPAPPTVAACQAALLSRLKSGDYCIASADKEGYRTLYYYHGAFLFVQVGDDGNSILHLLNDTILLNYLGRQSCVVLEMQDGQARWRYELTDAELLQSWQGIVARLQPATDATRRSVAASLNEMKNIADSGAQKPG